MTKRRRRRHSPEQVVKKLRDADAMLNSGQDLTAVLQKLEIAESTLDRWRKQRRVQKAFDFSATERTMRYLLSGEH